MTATAKTDDQQTAIWLRWWRYLAARGDEPFPHVRLCPCGDPEEVCRCARNDPGNIRHYVRMTIK